MSIRYNNAIKMEEVIEFVKRTHEDFENKEYSSELIEQMNGFTFRDWCDDVAGNNDFSVSPLMKKYFNFKQLLLDEWEYSACLGGGCEYYLVYRNPYEDKFTFIRSLDEFNAFHSKCWVITIPTQ